MLFWYESLFIFSLYFSTSHTLYNKHLISLDLKKKISIYEANTPGAAVHTIRGLPTESAWNILGLCQGKLRT